MGKHLIGVQTKGIFSEPPKAEEVALIRRAGFDCIDFSLDAFLLNSDIYRGELNDFFSCSEQDFLDIFRPLKETLKKEGLRISQMHVPYPLWILDPENDRTEQNEYIRKEVLPKSFALAKLLEIPFLVLHSIKCRGLSGYSAELRKNVEFFRELIPNARMADTIICLENLYGGFAGRLTDGPCSDPEEAKRYLEELNSAAGEERFGFCLDTGHMNLVHRSAREFTETLGKHIKILHIHDNNGKEDLHQLPFSFRDPEGKGGGVDWEEWIEAMKEIGYEGALSFETFPCMNAFPPELQEAALRAICGIGRYFASRLGA
ncbi:MAG: sugar phosphate isomerase/epimerase [Lachnospiraceae bacterium]|nr:sugar phosphate isomerase/epimerase [Lachnospiraceae bacterium]